MSIPIIKSSIVITSIDDDDEDGDDDGDDNEKPLLLLLWRNDNSTECRGPSLDKAIIVHYLFVGFSYRYKYRRDILYYHCRMNLKKFEIFAVTSIF